MPPQTFLFRGIDGEQFDVRMPAEEFLQQRLLTRQRVTIETAKRLGPSAAILPPATEAMRGSWNAIRSWARRRAGADEDGLG